MPDAKIVKTAEKQIERIEEILEAQKKANQETSRRRAEFAVVLGQVYEAFEQKAAGTEICGFKTFDDLVEHLSSKFDMHRRQIYKHLSVSRTLDGQVTPQQLADLGIEKAYVLARIEKFRPGYVKRPGFVEQASHMTVDELECKSDGLLQGKDELMQTGKWNRLSVLGPREYISDIKEGIRIARLQLGDVPSDAEILAHLITTEVQALVAEEEHARQKIAGN